MKLISKLIICTTIAVLVSTCGCAGVMGPDPQVVSVNSEKTLDGLNTVDEVTVLLKNNGYEGNVNVKAVYNSNKGRTFSERQNVYLDEGASKYITFVFDTEYDEEGTVTVTTD
ncbi:hypothetical protein HNP86_001326 [Methanococcus maripaludis]|uniref:CARDB domain-containing protein n=1 Tax=Methanococcus maripaludis TaxID=39152 RepID=A0A7J9NV45_METMI|nr:hypothetical protein [Methanococcus maripaludis]MBA2851195.1 hypothetical protein [Methanococcus maripaludis]